MDVRGHGRSDDGPWSWRAAVEDVEAVAEHFQMSAPAALGHSLGGMIASMWGRKHPEAAGVINLDGHGNPRPDQYMGLDPAWVAERRAGRTPFSGVALGTERPFVGSPTRGT